MNRSECHYLSCINTNCEQVACVARRDYENKILNLESENEKLKKLCRYQYLTLGFYATDYNYSEPIQHPDGIVRINIMMDHGIGAKRSIKLIEKLGLNKKEMADDWPGPGFSSKEIME